MDTQEQETAAWRLNMGKIRQTTSARLYIDQIQEECDKAGYTVETHRRDLIVAGLKQELADAVATQEYTTYQGFIALLIRTDENRQQNKERNRGNTSQGQGGQQKKDGKDKPKGESKYKLTEEEQKEHYDKKLCFNCHKPGHNSKECKGAKTVYKEVRKTQVAEVETSDKTPTNAEASSSNTSKGKEKEKEDFMDSE
jgi:hypothetical protein